MPENQREIMKILLIMPDARIHRLQMGLHRVSFREAPLTLTTLAALVPPELNAEVRIVDESLDTVPFAEHFDLVGISCLTGTASRAYELSRYFMAKGSTVVLGGVHVSLLPEEARRFAHSIVIGFAENTWPRLLRDFANRILQPVYEERSPSLVGLPQPHRHLQKRFGYLNPNTVFATRGCKRSCDFCAVSAVPFGWHTRPVQDVIDEIRHFKGKRFAFNDVSLLEDREYAKELFTALIPLRKVWGGLCTADVGQDPAMLDLMRRSGCVYLLIGFESVSHQALYSIRKGFNQPDGYRALMRAIHARDIIIQGCFIFGFDQDEKDVFSRTLEAVDDLKIDIPRYAVYTPYPRTKAFIRLKAEGRILHENWKYYDTQHVVFRPARMTPEELDRGFKWAYRKTFRTKSILKRISESRASFPVKLAGNLAYKFYIRRLMQDPDRFPAAPGGRNGGGFDPGQGGFRPGDLCEAEAYEHCLNHAGCRQEA